MCCTVGSWALCNDPASARIANGRLQLRIRHPGTISARLDSDYVMGSVGNARARVRVNGTIVPVWPSGAFLAYVPFPERDSSYHVEAVLDDDTARLTYRPRATAEDPDTLNETADEDAALAQREGVFASDSLGGARDWLLLRGTPARVIARAGEHVRVVANGIRLWLRARDTSFLSKAASAASGPLRIGPDRVLRGSMESAVFLPLSQLAPIRIMSAADSLVLIVAHATTSDNVEHSPRDPVLRLVTRSTSTEGARYLIRTRGPVYGFSVAASPRAIVLTIRKPPPIAAGNPLAGRTILIDAGHPPGGAIGPTGLEEPDVTFEIAEELSRLLTRRGARVLRTRAGHRPVSLAERLVIADTSRADAMVSIHVDAVPDGWNPFAMRGSATFAFEGESFPLALAVQWGVRRRLHTADRGVRKADFAVLRPTWTPSVLCEGAVITLPDEEASLRTPRFRQQYAQGIADGLSLYFRQLAQEWAN